MKRIFADYAYDDGRIAGCFWSEAVPDETLKRRAPEGDLTCDVVIVGAGYTGLSAALFLARAGVDVVVLDAKFPGWGASGRNGGFCCLGGSMQEDTALDRAYGVEARRDWRQTERAAVETVAELIARHGIEADTQSKGETLLAHKPSAARFDADIARCEENYGVTPEVIARDDLVARGLNGPFHGGMTIPIGFGLHPRKYLSGLLRAAEAAGARVFGQAPVSRIARHGTAWRVGTPGGTVRAEQVILATNGYSSEDVPEWMAARYLPAQSSVIVTRRLSAQEQASQGWTSDQMAYDTRALLHYFRKLPDGRFLFGMRGGLRSTPASDRSIQRLIRRDFEAMFPAWKHVETPHYWTGMVCLSANLLPYCGPVPDMPGVFAGFAYHGNGVAMGSHTGAILADLVQGREVTRAYAEIMQKPAGRFPLGRFRRTLMFPAYAGFWLRDRFG